MIDVYAVHVVRSEEIQLTEVIFTRLPAAEKHAQAVSRDTEVLASAVTRFVLDELGRRTAVALFVEGRRQKLPYLADNNRIWANGLMR